MKIEDNETLLDLDVHDIDLVLSLTLQRHPYHDPKGFIFHSLHVQETRFKVY